MMSLSLTVWVMTLVFVVVDKIVTVAFRCASWCIPYALRSWEVFCEAFSSLDSIFVCVNGDGDCLL